MSNITCHKAPELSCFVTSADPVINEPPSENITIEGHNASFTCSVRGFPAPLVEWELNGMVLSSDSHSRRDGNYMITSSALMIMSVTFEMNGVVRCIGRTPSTFTGNRVLDQANSTTTLVIYCKFTNIMQCTSEICTV